MNRGWLEKKERQRVEREEAAARGEEVKLVPRKRAAGKRGFQPARATPGDAVNHTLSKKRISKKINYDAIKLLGGTVEKEGDGAGGSNVNDTVEPPQDEVEYEIVLSPPTSPKKRARTEPAEKEKVVAAAEEEEEEEEEGGAGAGSEYFGRGESQDMDEGYFDDDYGGEEYYDEA